MALIARRRRVLVISTNHPSPANRLTAPFNHYLLAELARLCDLTVVTPISWASRLQPHVPVMARLAPHRPPTYPLHHPRLVNVPVVGRSLNGRALASSVRMVLDATASSFDGVLATYAYPDGAAAVELGHELRLPCVVKVGGSDVHSLHRGTASFRRTALVLEAATALVAVSSELAHRCTDMGIDPARVHVVRSGVDSERFRIVARERARFCLGLDKSRPMILFVGRFEPVKDLDTLLDAFERVGGWTVERSLAPQLLLVGYGSERSRIERRIATSRWRNNIKLLNPVPHASLMLWMNAANVLALSSRREGSPNVIREAHACGTPVVTTRVGDVAEWVDETSGAIVPVGDDVAMADALLRVLGSPYDRLTIRARVASASWGDAASSYQQILESAVAEVVPTRPTRATV